MGLEMTPEERKEIVRWEYIKAFLELVTPIIILAGIIYKFPKYFHTIIMAAIPALIIFGLAIVILTYFKIRKRFYLIDNGTLTNAIVTTKARCDDEFLIYYTFNAMGRDWKSSGKIDSDYAEELSEGDSIEILYDELNPKKSVPVIALY